MSAPAEAAYAECERLTVELGLQNAVGIRNLVAR